MRDDARRRLRVQQPHLARRSHQRRARRTAAEASQVRLCAQRHVHAGRAEPRPRRRAQSGERDAHDATRAARPARGHARAAGVEAGAAGAPPGQSRSNGRRVVGRPLQADAVAEEGREWVAGEEGETARQGHDLVHEGIQRERRGSSVGRRRRRGAEAKGLAGRDRHAPVPGGARLAPSLSGVRRRAALWGDWRRPRRVARDSSPLARGRRVHRDGDAERGRGAALRGRAPQAVHR
mmetsp:Transcript_11459/g.36402  ORF Transcript_11459/g.36402 Transcript_11459/m.36402 type:complete len:236 (+) Transcript_11459:2560-3267(+)